MVNPRLEGVKFIVGWKTSYWDSTLQSSSSWEDAILLMENKGNEGGSPLRTRVLDGRFTVGRTKECNDFSRIVLWEEVGR